MIYSISLKKVMEELQFEEIYMPVSADQIKITNREVMRPGLALAGHFGYFEPARIQIIGISEADYIEKIPVEERESVFDKFFSYNESFCKPSWLFLNRIT